MASAVGIAVLETMEQEKTMENSKEVGTYLLQKLVHLVDRWLIFFLCMQRCIEGFFIVS